MRSALLDGEVAVVLPDGTTSFQALQNALAAARPGRSSRTSLFDLLHLEAVRPDARARSRSARRLLEDLLRHGRRAAPLRYSDHVAGSGRAFFAQACRLALEGIVSKRRDAPLRGRPQRSPG